MVRTRLAVRSIRPLLGYLRVRAIDLPALLRRVGLGPSELEDIDARIDADLSVRLWHEAERELQDPLLGLRVGFSVTRESFDLLSQATAASSTLREMGQRLTRFAAMAAPGPIYELRESGASAWWLVADVFPGAHCVRHFCELSVGLGINYMRQYAPAFKAPLRVHLDHEKAAPASEYQRLCAAEVSFSQHESGFEIPRTLLDQPLPRADPGLAHVLDRYAEETLKKLPQASDLVETVRLGLGTLLEGGASTELAALAKQLGLSSRSLQRQLQERGTSFQGLVDKQRQSLALRLMQQDGATIEQIAEQLGFSDSAAFRRAFKRWTGLAPRAFRERSRP